MSNKVRVRKGRQCSTWFGFAGFCFGIWVFILGYWVSSRFFFFYLGSGLLVGWNLHCPSLLYITESEIYIITRFQVKETIFIVSFSHNTRDAKTQACKLLKLLCLKVG